jgi:hypothetical protein
MGTKESSYFIFKLHQRSNAAAFWPPTAADADTVPKTQLFKQWITPSQKAKGGTSCSC